MKIKTGIGSQGRWMKMGTREEDSITQSKIDHHLRIFGRRYQFAIRVFFGFVFSRLLA